MPTRYRTRRGAEDFSEATKNLASAIVVASAIVFAAATLAVVLGKLIDQTIPGTRHDSGNNNTLSRHGLGLELAELSRSESNPFARRYSV